MRRAKIRTLVSLMLVILVSCSCTTGVPEQDPYPAPSLNGSDLEGRQWNLEEHRGAVVLVSVWASWCGPCRDEVPVLSDIDTRYGPEDLQVLGLIFRDNPDAARQFIEEEHPTFPSVVDPKGTIAVEWGVTALPQSFLVDRSGTVVARHFGAVTQEWIDDVVIPQVSQ